MAASFPTPAPAGKLYEVVASVIRHRIRDGLWRAEQQLPGLDELAAEFGVSNITIRQALRDLEQDGLVLRRQGVGTFVSAGAGRPDLLLRLESSWGSLIHAQDPIQVSPLETASVAGLGPLQPTEADGRRADRYRYIKRLHSIDGRPFAVVWIMLDDAIYQRDPEAFETRRVIHILDRYDDIHVADARQSLCIGVADIDVAQHLGIALGSPVGRLRRVLLDQRGVAILIAHVVYPGDLVRLEMSLPLSQGGRDPD